MVRRFKVYANKFQDTPEHMLNLYKKRLHELESLEIEFSRSLKGYREIYSNTVRDIKFL